LKKEGTIILELMHCGLVYQVLVKKLQLRFGIPSNIEEAISQIFQAIVSLLRDMPLDTRSRKLGIIFLLAFLRLLHSLQILFVQYLIIHTVPESMSNFRKCCTDTHITARTCNCLVTNAPCSCIQRITWQMKQINSGYCKFSNNISAAGE
jgi:hypothetical protein